MIEKYITDGTCHAEHRYGKTNDKYMKGHDPSTELSCPIYWDAKNLYGWTVSQKLPVDGSKWKKKNSRFNKKFIQNYDNESYRGLILKTDVSYPKGLQKIQKVSYSCLKEKRITNDRNLL